MRLVVDANILVAALLRHSTTREILLHADHAFYAPVWLANEIHRHLPMIEERSGSPPEIISTLLERLTARIQFVPEELLRRHADAARRLVGPAGPKDAPYIACALAVEAVVWTHDRELSAQVPNVTTERLLG